MSRLRKREKMFESAAALGEEKHSTLCRFFFGVRNSVFIVVVVVVVVTGPVDALILATRGVLQKMIQVRNTYSIMIMCRESLVL